MSQSYATKSKKMGGKNKKNIIIIMINQCIGEKKSIDKSTTKIIISFYRFTLGLQVACSRHNWEANSESVSSTLISFEKETHLSI